jgi:putative aldouronate transport system permease protein
MVRTKPNRIREAKGDRLFGFAIAVLTTIVLAVILFPLWFVIIASISDPNSLNRGEVLLLPKGITWLGYQDLFKTSQLAVGYLNTILYTIAGTALNIALTICAAYPMSRKDLDGKNLFTTMITITMFFGGGIIPSYIVNRNIGIVNTGWIMLLPGAINAWNYVVMRTFFQTAIPGELLESSKIDGCSDFRFIGSILLPLSAPIIAVMSLYYGSGHWNDYFTPLIYIRDSKLQPLQTVLRDVLIKNIQLDATADIEDFSVGNTRKAELVKYCMIIVSSAPLMALFPFLQKYFAKGALVGSIKG